MKELLRQTTEVTVSPRVFLSDVSAVEASLALAARLDKLIAKNHLTVVQGVLRARGVGRVCEDEIGPDVNQCEHTLLIAGGLVGGTGSSSRVRYI